jgi:MFS family permease
MEGIIIISVVAGFITGYIGMYVAKEKNRSGSEGFWFGFLLSLIGVIIVALLPTKEANLEPKKAEFTEEQLEEKKKKFEQAQKDNKRTARIWLIISFLLTLIIAIYLSNK